MVAFLGCRFRNVFVCTHTNVMFAVQLHLCAWEKLEIQSDYLSVINRKRTHDHAFLFFFNKYMNDYCLLNKSMASLSGSKLQFLIVI